MHNLNEYLQQLVSKAGSELHLEPNKPPYVITSNGYAEISNSPLPGAQINTIIFSLIPANIKQQLPNSSQVEFVHSNNLSDFNFLVKKSPSGFVVTISPPAGNSAAKQIVYTEEKVEVQQLDDAESTSVRIKIKEWLCSMML